MNDRSPLGLFEAFGVELEYMIVDDARLNILPIADQVLCDADGLCQSEIDWGEISWSNELVLHVIELKTSGPEPALGPLPARFQDHVSRVNQRLAARGARLMPTAMHPWMDPHREMQLWPHENGPVYAAFNRVFDCRGHGWANLQSVHLNLPFTGDDQFGRLHAAIRLLLPILPALAASSPVSEGQLSSYCDTRLEFYRHHTARIPSVTAAVIPEPVFTRRDYEARIFAPMYAAVAEFDPHGVLHHEWLNARGAIARFERDTIEIRVLDVQECPQADLAICAAVVAVLQAVVDQRWLGFAAQQSMETAPLAALFLNVVRDAERTIIDDRDYLQAFGVDRPVSAGELWRRLLDEVAQPGESLAAWQEPLDVILQQGPLARRILRRLDGDASVPRLAAVYRELCECLAQGRMFSVPADGSL